jgi:hypothetical protein
MPIGSPLTNSVASVGASGTGYATATNALLTELKAAVEGTVPFSALDGSVLDLDNVPMIDASYVAFYDASVVPSAAIAGRLVYANGEFWAVNSTGAIQLTSGVGLNAASIGGIAGDYGSPNPASLRFVDLATRYEFYDDYSTLTWAYTRARGLDIAAGAISNVYCQLRYGGAATLTLTLPPALPASNRSALVIDNTGAILFNSATNTVTNDIVLAGTTRVREIGRKKGWCFNFQEDWLTGTGSAWSGLVTASGGSRGVRIDTKGTGGGVAKNINGLDVGTTITSLTARINKQSTGTAAVVMFKTRDGVDTLIPFTGGTSAATGWLDLTQTGSYVVESGYTYYCKVGAGDNNDEISGFEITYNS